MLLIFFKLSIKLSFLPFPLRIDSTRYHCVIVFKHTRGCDLKNGKFRQHKVTGIPKNFLERARIKKIHIEIMRTNYILYTIQLNNSVF